MSSLFTDLQKLLETIITKVKTENLNALNQVCKNTGFDISEARVAVVFLMKFP